MITGKYIYKCKNCGERFIHSSSSIYANMLLNFYAILKTGKPISKKITIGQWPEKFEIHDCDAEVTLKGLGYNEKDKVLGIAELVGLWERSGNEKE